MTCFLTLTEVADILNTNIFCPIFTKIAQIIFKTTQKFFDAFLYF